MKFVAVSSILLLTVFTVSCGKNDPGAALSAGKLAEAKKGQAGSGESGNKDVSTKQGGVPALPQIKNNKCANPFAEIENSKIVKPSQLVVSSGKWVAVNLHMYQQSRTEYPEAEVYLGLDEELKAKLKESVSLVSQIDLDIDLKDVKDQEGNSTDAKHKLVCTTLEKPVDEQSSDSKTKSSGNQNLNGNIPLVLDAATLKSPFTSKMTFQFDGKTESFNWLNEKGDSKGSLLDAETKELPKDLQIAIVKVNDKRIKLRITSSAKIETKQKLSYDHDGKSNSADLSLPTRNILIMETEFEYVN